MVIVMILLSFCGGVAWLMTLLAAVMCVAYRKQLREALFYGRQYLALRAALQQKKVDAHAQRQYPAE